MAGPLGSFGAAASPSPSCQHLETNMGSGEKVAGHTAGESEVWSNCSWSPLRLRWWFSPEKQAHPRKHGKCVARDASEMGSLVRCLFPNGFQAQLCCVTLDRFLNLSVHQWPHL